MEIVKKEHSSGGNIYEFEGGLEVIFIIINSLSHIYISYHFFPEPPLTIIYKDWEFIIRELKKNHSCSQFVTYVLEQELPKWGISKELLLKKIQDE